MNESEEENETICILIGAQKSGVFTFTQLKRDRTPKMLLNLPSFQGQRMMAEANPYEFYVFKTEKYPYLTQGTQINLNFDYYDSFTAGGGYEIYYDRRHFFTV